MEILLVLLLVLTCAAFSGRVAESKGHGGLSWGISGLVFGPLALLAAIGLSDLKTRKYLRLLAEHHGALDEKLPSPSPIGDEDAEAQRRRILGNK
ncbi:hypothetical protein [Cyanobium sp. WAJ14-Wanaka]|uniref:hypothetical protein n=1 Tax=Cyanobium sp. WAJ14-Wanaka TaxID=2823725 RepID=UPI0020CF608C|nr:hypothetical protein [Cyanobium sp. WAJ14-Wanaka]MCP9776214.1 hypothetical protein [Cyanobium sp. WAJ14-Wanaka]